MFVKTKVVPWNYFRFSPLFSRMGKQGFFILTIGEFMINISNLSKDFIQADSTVKALNNVNIDIEKGDIFGIIGISGAGKSTLLRCLSGLETPTGGDIKIEGKSIVGLTGSKLIPVRKQMGVVFQGYNLLMQKNVYDNIAFPLKIAGAKKDEIDRQVKRLLAVVDLSDKQNAYPSQLSGGQKQRVAIARALATNPKILLCDEPTSALDPMTTKQVLNLLTEINKELNVTVVIITHEIGVVRKICNRVAVISSGEVAEYGNVQDVFSNPQSEITKLLLDWQV